MNKPFLKSLALYTALFIGSMASLFATEKALMGTVDNGLYYSPSNLFICSVEDFGQGEYSITDHAEKGFELVQFTQSDENDSFVVGVIAVSNISKIPSFILNQLINRDIKKDKQEASKDEKVVVLERRVLENGNHFAVRMIKKKSDLKKKKPSHPQTFKGTLAFQHEGKIALMYMNMNFSAEKAGSPQECVETIKGKLLQHQKQMHFPATDSSLSSPHP